MQRLIMPFKRQMMLCGYKNPEYLAYWKYQHYGVDISTVQGGAGTDPTVYASGSGIVTAAGMDDRLGYGVCVFYPDAYDHQSGQSADVTARYMHLRSVMVKVGDAVKAGAPLGVEGKEGTKDYHLHLELDTDVKYPQYSPQVKGGMFWKKGVDTTVNPSHLLHVGEGQVIVKPTYSPAWLNPEDFEIPTLPVEVDYRALYEAASRKIEKIAQIIGGDI